MSKVVYCDCCQKACPENYFELSGWWHLVEEHSKSRVGERLSETISGDVCSQCRDQVGLKTNLEPTRQERRRRWAAANPEKPRLQALRKTACVYVEDVFCDRCQKVCSEQYARLSSSWLTANQETLYSDICPDCLGVMQVHASDDPGELGTVAGKEPCSSIRDR